MGRPVINLNKKPRILHIGMCVNPPPLNGLQRAFIKHSSEYVELHCGENDVNAKAIRLAQNMKPDIIFIQVQASNIISEYTAYHLKQTGAFIVNYTGDVRCPIPQFYYDLGKYIDYTLFSNMTDVLEMQEKGCRAEYLEIGIDETIYNPTGDVIPCKPIVFFGNNYGAGYFPMSEFRINMVSYLKTRFPNEFAVFGNGWLNADGNLNASQHEEAKAYRGTKIAINVSHFEYIKYSSDRLLRILGTGTAICLAKWYPSIEDDFKDGVHLRTWNTLEELENLCIHYMNPENESERIKIANAGMELAHEKFTFNNMIENLIEIYKKK